MRGTRGRSRDGFLALGAGAVAGIAVLVLAVPALAGGTPVAATRSLPRDAVEDLARDAVLLAEAQGCDTTLRQGTVTALHRNAETVGLTNAHVVDGAGWVLLGRPGDTSSATTTATITGPLASRDAAVVELGDGELGAEALSPGLRPSVGDEVLVAGYPGGEYLAEWGRVASIEDRVGRGGLTPVLVVDVEAKGGLSGGVVVDRSGAAVGLVAARDPDSGRVVAYPVGEVMADPEPVVAPTC